MNDPDEKKTLEVPDETASAAPSKQAGENTLSQDRVGHSRKTQWIVTTCILGVLCLVAAGIAFMAFWSKSPQGSGLVSQHQSLNNDGNKVVTQEEENITGVVDKVSPTVVSVTTKSQSESPYLGTQEQEGAGTGIIVGKNGYILTNKHVIDGATTVGVILSDGTSYTDVKVLGTDPLNDVAFLKIDGVSNLPAAELGDSTSVRVGQKVVAIGNSLGQYQNTVTSGIISGTGRPVSAQAGNSIESLTDLIQTDAAINPGNSGGPLLNLKGQVIGINTAIAQDAQGIGFSIPINSTKGVLKGVLAGGEVRRAYIGVNFIPITADVAKHYNLSVKKGAYVFSGNDAAAVVAGGPGAKAGIKDKDIITKIGSIEVGDRGGIASLVGEYAPGETIQVTLIRGGQTMTVTVTLEAYKT
ncbi:MAG TPA: trypsin-like peptidase domain-containing protein [Candidatus Saccharimonadales bacterium]|nr:trypsin-like peptidase domain-containing protein [Candidatus Saccharimonadales bacterium]